MISTNEVSGQMLTFYVLNFPVKVENEKDLNPLQNISFQVSIKLTRPASFAQYYL